MSSEKYLTELADQKRLLILQADLHRALLQAECAKARSRIEWLGSAREKLRGNPWVLAGGALAGLFAVRRWRKVLKWAPPALAAWRWFNQRKTD